MKTEKIIFTVLILGLFIRLISLNQSLWLDEATSAQVVRNFSYWEIINIFSRGDFHPPLYYLLLKSWAYLFGSSEIGLRSLSVLLGTATIYMVYLIGKEVNVKVGVLAALFLSVNGLHVYYSQEARMYVLSAFLTCLTVYFFIKTLESKKFVNWVLFSLFLAFNSITDYLPNLIIPVLWLSAIKFKKDRIWWSKFLLSHALLALIWLYWLPFFTRQLNFGVSVSSASPLWWNVLGKTNLKNLALVPIKFIFGRIDFENNFVYFTVSSVVFTGYLVIIFAGLYRVRRQKYCFWGWLLLPLILSALLGIWLPVFYYFRFLFVLPAFVLFLSSSVSNLPSRFQRASILFIFSVSFLSTFYYLLNPKFQREDWRSTVSYVEKNSKTEDYSVIFSSGNQTEAYLYYGDGKKIVGYDGLKYGEDKVWLIRYVQDLFDPKDEAKMKIESMGYLKVKEHNFNGIIVWEYNKL